MHVSKNLSKPKLGENWYFLKPCFPHFPMESYIFPTLRKPRESKTEKKQHMSRWAVSAELWVLDCSENWKQWKPTIIQHCKKKQRSFNITSTWEVILRIKESEHNSHLRLPCSSQKKARREKPKTYTRNWWTVNSWSDLYNLQPPGWVNIHIIFKRHFFVLNIAIFASDVLFCVLIRLLFFLFT